MNPASLISSICFWTSPCPASGSRLTPSRSSLLSAMCSPQRFECFLDTYSVGRGSNKLCLKRALKELTPSFLVLVVQRSLLLRRQHGLRHAQDCEREARCFRQLLVVDRVRNLPRHAECNAECNHVLLRQVVDDGAGVVLNHCLVENLPG